MIVYRELSSLEQDLGISAKVNTPGENRQFDRTSPTPLPLKSYTLSAAPTPSV